MTPTVKPAIESYERGIITAAVAEWGKWEGTRRKCAIRFQKAATEGAPIFWAVTRVHSTVSGRTKTVTEAIDEVNQAVEILESKR